MPQKSKTVLICPLDWGLGHATRCIPIINELLNQNAKVIIAGDGDGMDLLKKEFPHLKFIFLKGYRAKYNADGNMIVSMIKQLPRFVFRIIREHLQLEKIIADNKIDVVISDNRYGLWNKKIKTIFITHQLNIQTPESLNFIKPFINSINRFFISRFNECWVPDIEGKYSLSGKLSEQLGIQLTVFRIGLLSRFTSLHTSNFKPQTSNFKLVCILSGPEPQRTIFEGMLIEQLEKINKSVLIIRGRPNDKQELKSKFLIEFKNHATAEEMFEYMINAETIIARSGYSTIMDLVALGKKAILIPTPGQTEQEYLGKHFHMQKIFLSQKQDELDLQTALKEVESLLGINIEFDKTVLQNHVLRILS